MFVLLTITLTLLQPTFGEIEQKQFSELSTGLPENQANIAEFHNECRRSVNPPAQNMLEMRYDPAISKLAQEWADKCFCNHSSLGFRTRNNIHYGENILNSPIPVSWNWTINCWNDEKKLFTFGEKTKATIGHYTQVVWGATESCGCAVANCPNTICAYFYVCMYRWVGNLKENPFEPYLNGTTCGKCKNNCKNKLCQVACPVRNKAVLKDCEEVRARGQCGQYKEECLGSCTCPEGTVYQ